MVLPLTQSRALAFLPTERSHAIASSRSIGLASRIFYVTDALLRGRDVAHLERPATHCDGDCTCSVAIVPDYAAMSTTMLLTTARGVP